MPSTAEVDNIKSLDDSGQTSILTKTGTGAGGDKVFTLDNVVLGSSVTGIAGYRLSGMTVYTTVAGHIWTKGDVTAVLVIVTGGGGGGAGYGAGGDAGGGGGAGGTVTKFITSGLGSTETATIGAAGTAGASGQNDGGLATTTSFGSHCSATGGEGGQHGNGGVRKAAGGIGVEGTPVLNTPLLIKGGHGFAGRDDNAGGSGELNGGYGGASYWGGGGAGSTDTTGSTLTLNSQPGQAYGTGGGGGTDSQGAGAAGALGVIVIYEYKGGA